MNHPELLTLLRGELSNAAATEAGHHLQGCDPCRAELADLAVGNALLMRAHRTLSGARAEPTAPVDDLPPLRRRGVVRPRLLLVAAAVMVVGLGAAGVAMSLLDGSTDASSPPASYASADLAPVDEAAAGAAIGRVQMAARGDHLTELTIQAPDLPVAGDGRYYYAWLLDPETDKMLPLGQIGPGGTGAFELDDALIAEYSAVDVSLEDDDGDPGHSVTSVLRGSYDRATATTS
ncbi:MAG: anti-sigma factor [Nocardioides sp.]